MASLCLGMMGMRCGCKGEHACPMRSRMHECQSTTCVRRHSGGANEVTWHKAPTCRTCQHKHTL